MRSLSMGAVRAPETRLTFTPPATSCSAAPLASAIVIQPPRGSRLALHANALESRTGHAEHE